MYPSIGYDLGYDIYVKSNPGSLLTTPKNILTPNLSKSQSKEILVESDPIILKFGSCPGSSAAEAPNFRAVQLVLNSILLFQAFTRFGNKMSQHLVIKAQMRYYTLCYDGKLDL